MNTFCPLKIQSLTARERILQAAHEEMYEHGYQGLRIDAVLKKTQLAKGALYHYFPNKLSLGYAVVDELIMGYFQRTWHELLSESNDPLKAIKTFFRMKCDSLQIGECANGCPLSNLIQEMSTLDEGFHQRLQKVMVNVVAIASAALIEGQVHNTVRKDINPQKVAMFLLSSYQGIMGAAKCLQSTELMAGLFDTLNEYVESLREK